MDYGSAEAGVCHSAALAPKITRITRNTLPCVYVYVRECVRIILIADDHLGQIRLRRCDSPHRFASPEGTIA